MLQGSLQNCSHIAGKPNMHLDLRPNRRQAHFCIVLIEGSLEEQPPTLMSGRWRNGCVMRISWNSRSPSVHWHTSWLSGSHCPYEAFKVYEVLRKGKRRESIFLQSGFGRRWPASENLVGPRLAAIRKSLAAAGDFRIAASCGPTRFSLAGHRRPNLDCRNLLSLFLSLSQHFIHFERFIWLF